MEKITFAFGFRYEKKLGFLIRYICRKTGLSQNGLVEHALLRLSRLHDSGKIRLYDRSGFLRRRDRKHKVETALSLTPVLREMVRNLAFSYRKSMAEVIRLALEMYIDLLLKGEDKLDDVFHIYREAQQLMHTVIISLYPVLPPGKIPYPIII